MTTKIKICGLTDPAEAALLGEVRADYAGMVLFFEKSRRCISTDRARQIIKALDPGILPVAVMVSPDPDQVREACRAGFAILQIHGELTMQALEAASVPVWKAFNGSDMDLAPSFGKDHKVTACVFDAALPGSGKTFDWDRLKGMQDPGRPFFLAGGLDPENVRQAILEVRPFGVDVSSGVEYRGRQGKDPERVRAFAGAVREADSFLNEESAL